MAKSLVGEEDFHASIMGKSRAPGPLAAAEAPATKKSPPKRGKKKKGKRPPPAQAMYG